MPRTYKSKNIHTKPSESGVKNMPEGFEEKHKQEDMGIQFMSDLFKIATEKRKRKTAWTEEDLTREIIGYFNYCEEKSLKPYIGGLALYLGCSKSTMFEWMANPTKYGVVSDLVNHAKVVMEGQYINRSEKYPTANLFLLRTSHGHVETSKVDVQTTNTQATKEEIGDIVSKLGLDKPKGE